MAFVLSVTHFLILRLMLLGDHAPCRPDLPAIARTLSDRYDGPRRPARSWDLTVAIPPSCCALSSAEHAELIALH